RDPGSAELLLADRQRGGHGTPGILLADRQRGLGGPLLADRQRGGMRTLLADRQRGVRRLGAGHLAQILDEQLLQLLLAHDVPLRVLVKSGRWDGDECLHPGGSLRRGELSLPSSPFPSMRALAPKGARE